MKYLLLSLLVLSVSAMAATTATKSTTKSGMIKDDSKGTLNLESKSKESEASEEKALVMDPKDVKMDVSCTAKDGHELKQGEKGYEACLKKAKHDKKNPHDPKADIKVDFKKE